VVAAQRLEGAVALITGGTSGIGLSVAQRLAGDGAAVVITGRDGERGAAAAAALGEPALFVAADAAIQADVERSRDAALERFGRLDILVNNAGIAAGAFPGNGPEHSVSGVAPDLLHKIFETNFFAQVALTRALLPLLKKSPAGRIVNLSSILASLTLHADPASPIYDAKSFAYDASKTALNAFTIHLAHELRDTKIKVNSAHPGWVKTRMGGPNATMELSEGAKTSAALATLPDDGPTGGFFHLGQPLPW